jgi:hypothetical protein
MAGLLTCGVLLFAPSQAFAQWHMQTAKPLTVAGAVTELNPKVRTVFPFKSFAESLRIPFGPCTLRRIRRAIKKKKSQGQLFQNMDARNTI